MVQETELMRMNILPRCYFELCLGQCNLHLLSTLDSIIRCHLMAWLHLPAYTPRDLFYLLMRDRGLRILKLFRVIFKARVKNSLYILK